MRWINLFFAPSFITLPLSTPISGVEVAKIIAVFGTFYPTGDSTSRLADADWVVRSAGLGHYGHFYSLLYPRTSSALRLSKKESSAIARRRRYQYGASWGRASQCQPSDPQSPNCAHSPCHRFWRLNGANSPTRGPRTRVSTHPRFYSGSGSKAFR